MKNYLIMIVFFILGTIVGALVHARWKYVLFTRIASRRLMRKVSCFFP